jgi:hypothetical protein
MNKRKIWLLDKCLENELRAVEAYPHPAGDSDRPESMVYEEDGRLHTAVKGEWAFTFRRARSMANRRRKKEISRLVARIGDLKALQFETEE